jgi:acyl-CoA reductase-like NAD-dependent aldehyde dehydrogenase
LTAEAVNGKVITSVAAGTAADIDIAAQAAKKAFKERWGLKVPGAQRGRILNKLADLLQANADEFSALEALDVGRVILELHILLMARPYVQVKPSTPLGMVISPDLSLS